MKEEEEKEMKGREALVRGNGEQGLAITLQRSLLSEILPPS